MKTPDSLNQKIWKECALEVATKFKERRPFTQSECREAALLAMEKQAGFLLWTFWMDWIYSDGRFMNSKSGDVVSDLELYAIWKEGKGV